VHRENKILLPVCKTNIAKMFEGTIANLIPGM
jgi:hypothetical protein